MCDVVWLPYFEVVFESPEEKRSKTAISIICIIIILLLLYHHLYYYQTRDK